MKKRDFKKLMDLSTQLYFEEQKKTGMVTPIPYVWAKQGEALLIFSAFGKHSTNITNALNEADLEDF